MEENILIGGCQHIVEFGGHLGKLVDQYVKCSIISFLVCLFEPFYEGLVEILLQHRRGDIVHIDL